MPAIESTVRCCYALHLQAVRECLPPVQRAIDTHRPAVNALQIFANASIVWMSVSNGQQAFEGVAVVSNRVMIVAVVNGNDDSPAASF